VRINAEARNNGLSYSRMIDGMSKADIEKLRFLEVLFLVKM
jgi:ribosomal protein L20